MFIGKCKCPRPWYNRSIFSLSIANDKSLRPAFLGAFWAALNLPTKEFSGSLKEFTAILQRIKINLSYLTEEAKQPFHGAGARLWEILRRASRWELVKRNLRSPYSSCPRWQAFPQKNVQFTTISGPDSFNSSEQFSEAHGKFQIILEFESRGTQCQRHGCFCSCHLSLSRPLSVACHGLPKSTDFCPSSLQFTVLP